MIDETHDAKRQSWVASANGHADFPVQNLPIGAFSPPGSTPRGGIAIGDTILDTAMARDAGLFSGLACEAAEAAAGRTLNAFLEAGTQSHRLSRSNANMLYWTVAQMVAHHTSNGCNLAPGDISGSGTVSGTEPGTSGCLLAMTMAGRDPVTLPNGAIRRYLEDGDDIVFRAQCVRPGAVSIGFGECRSRAGG